MTLKAVRQAQDKLRVLSVNGEVARSGLGRFAAFGPPTRIFSENAKRRQAACSAACPFDCAGEICKPRSGVKSSAQHLTGSSCEDTFHRFESLELQRIARWIEAEHRTLLAWLTPKPYLWLDDPGHARSLQAVPQRFPVIPFEDRAEMPDRDRITIHTIGPGRRAFIRLNVG